MEGDYKTLTSSYVIFFYASIYWDFSTALPLGTNHREITN